MEEEELNKWSNLEEENNVFSEFYNTQSKHLKFKSSFYIPECFLNEFDYNVANLLTL